ncbi:hypothetical protein WR25_04900 [Diploscapter pachys]|uniref:Uncharacterized protein n=1 Tax=Diploscapter pachys TaxID=2018661 RepID=A0A2A2M5W9_9BILA|nr:hypothetical protein WR25_04900 [Diploscapter pachys]
MPDRPEGGLNDLALLSPLLAASIGQARSLRLEQRACPLLQRNSTWAHSPPSARLRKVRLPPMAWVSCWAMASPSPVPPVLRLRELSTR